MPNANKYLREIDRLLDKVWPGDAVSDPFLNWLIAALVLAGVLAWALSKCVG